MKRQLASCRRDHCGHVGTIHAVNTHRGQEQYGRCLVARCTCLAYQAPGRRTLAALLLDALAYVANLLAASTRGRL